MIELYKPFSFSSGILRRLALLPADVSSMCSKQVSATPPAFLFQGRDVPLKAVIGASVPFLYAARPVATVALPCDPCRPAPAAPSELPTHTLDLWSLSQARQFGVILKWRFATNSQVTSPNSVTPTVIELTLSAQHFPKPTNP